MMREIYKGEQFCELYADSQSRGRQGESAQTGQTSVYMTRVNLSFRKNPGLPEGVQRPGNNFLAPTKREVSFPECDVSPIGAF